MLVLILLLTSKMKFLVILCSLTVLAWAQEVPECDCGAFITEAAEEEEVFPMEAFDVENCEDQKDCHDRCRTEWNEITSEGDLNFELPDGKTVGQSMCDDLAEEGKDVVGPTEVFLYVRLCDGPWEDDGEATMEMLCCDAGQHEPCE
ncbi:uncharacterized protein LOC121877881 isoform X1 [Homarus americanus]|uniref:uncharacterized protein LOC121877881 isoform X1 n=1 Tax=Homarus americanus TaxID=6706 RepID=UPI001C46B6D6|nr:uncharacterized protein LOC121877881 isoform X1 [Homarus americanus]